MIENFNTLNAEALLRLDALRGTTLRRIFGFNLDVRLMSEDVSVETDQATITLWGDVEDLGDWEGFEGQYSVLRIDEGVPSIYADTDVAAVNGANEEGFFFHAGELIEDVFIVRERVAKVVSDEVEWEYTTDVAVIFELSKGALAISKAALDGEMLNVTIADSFDRLTLPPAGALWFHWNVLGTEFLRSSELLSVEDLVTARGA